MRSVRRLGIASLLLLALAACTRMYDDHGWAPSDRDLEVVVVGKTTRDQVKEQIGVPGATGVLQNSAWYYVQSRYENYAWHAPKEIDRQVVAISFNKNDVVSNVERFGLDQGQVVVLSQRVTTDSISTNTFLRQLFGSLGKFSPQQFTGPIGRNGI